MITESWYTNLVEELRDIVTETEFSSRWSLVEGRHQLGSRILQEYDNFQRLRMPDSELVQCIALSIQRNKRTIYYAIQFAREYPDLNLLPEGKDCSWWKIVNKYLTAGKEKPAIKKTDLYRMIKEIKELLEREYHIAHQELVGGSRDFRVRDFIRYLQDQVNKITEGLNETID